MTAQARQTKPKGAEASQPLARLTLDATLLHRHLQALKAVVPARPIIPIHECVRLHVEDQTLFMVAGNEAASMQRQQWLGVGDHEPSHADADFALCVGYRELSGLVATCTGTLVLDQHLTHLTITTPTGTVTLPTEKFSHYPAPPQLSDEPVHELSWPEAEALAHALGRVEAFCHPSAEFGAQSYAWGWAFADGEFRLLSYNGRHAALERLDLTLPLRVGVIRPQVGLVKAHLLGAKAPALLRGGTTWLHIDTAGQRLSLRQPAVSPPDFEALWEGVTGKDYPARLSLAKKDALGLLARLDILAPPDEKRLGLQQTVAWDGSARFRYDEDKMGHHLDEVAGEVVAPCTLAPPKAIPTDALKAAITLMDTESVTLHSGPDPRTGVLVQPVGANDRLVFISPVLQQ